jgi:hypothetical protein
MTKMDWATFWAIFSQSHLVTLTKSFVRISNYVGYFCVRLADHNQNLVMIQNSNIFQDTLSF